MRLLAELQLAVSLLTRLPVGPIRAPVPPLSACGWAYPLAGMLAALPGAGIWWLLAPHLPPLMAAVLALMAGALVTGALHEDGLSDTVDGFFGGRTLERRLEIMKDSRIGSYGALALALSVLLRTAALAATDPEAGALALLAFAALSRAPLPYVMATLPPARPGGLGASAGEQGAFGPALGALVIAGAATSLTGGTLLFGATALIVAIAMSWLSLRRILGYTGDTLGATQQAIEMALWVAFFLR